MPEDGAIYLVTLGGEGFLYRIDTSSGAWSVVRSMENRDATGVFFDREGRRLLIFMGARLKIQHLDSGAVTEVPMEMMTFPGLSDLFDPGNGPPPSPRILAVAGDTLLIVAALANVFPNTPDLGAPFRMWSYDLGTDESALLVYR